MDKLQHGGARKGAGRKALAPSTRRLSVTLTEAQIARAKALGEGSIAQGIRKALEVTR